MNEDPAFPATKHFAPSFAFTDEFYQAKEFSRDQSACCCGWTCRRCRRTRSSTRGRGDFPIAWAKMYGKGRVFYSSLGHASSTWDNPDVYRMYFEALKWSLGLTDGDATAR